MVDRMIHFLNWFCTATSAREAHKLDQHQESSVPAVLT